MNITMGLHVLNAFVCMLILLEDSMAWQWPILMLVSIVLLSTFEAMFLYKQANALATSILEVS